MKALIQLHAALKAELQALEQHQSNREGDIQSAKSSSLVKVRISNWLNWSVVQLLDEINKDVEAQVVQQDQKVEEKAP